jgi:GH35 family endo-1,4-beta-xylanase
LSRGKPKGDRRQICLASRIRQQAERYKEIFRIAAHYPAVKNITTWGIADKVGTLVETGFSLND